MWARAERKIRQEREKRPKEGDKEANFERESLRVLLPAGGYSRRFFEYGETRAGAVITAVIGQGGIEGLKVEQTNTKGMFSGTLLVLTPLIMDHGGLHSLFSQASEIIRRAATRKPADTRYSLRLWYVTFFFRSASAP